MKTNCLRCNGELVTVEGEFNGVKTQFCKECGLIHNTFTAEMVAQLMENVQEVGKDDNAN